MPPSRLKRLGYDDLAILEREDDLGGTWHVNRYPGLAVDIPSSTYSYSFEPNPHWSRLFAPGSELKAYAVHVADKYDLRRHMRFDTVVQGARWDEESSTWVVTLEGGETVAGRFLLTATGFLSQPKAARHRGHRGLRGHGRAHHPLGRRHRVWRASGSASSAPARRPCRLIPEAGQGGRPPDRLPAHTDLRQPEDGRQGARRRARRVREGAADPEGHPPGRYVDPRAPHGRRSAALPRPPGGQPDRQAGVRGAPQAPGEGPRAAGEASWPDYDFGCKRPTFSNTYFPTFTKDHVDLETTTISHVDANGIVTEDGRRADLDVLVLATGFNLWDTNFPAIEIIGREGRDLGKWWRETRFSAYEGIAVPKFPNFFSLNSPYSYSGLSYFTTIETQMAHMDRLLKAMNKKGSSIFEVTEEANTEFLDRMTGLLGNSVFNAGQCSTARSYYFNQHGEAVLLRPTSTLSAHREAVSFPLEDYAFSNA
ncbi:NAD(P)/FAD-dependent oxidoreductase [Nocardioides convexus]|uniref:flavin-containing monooxygenase n=1 Tax=Nocardioides convexus TaxID=2712224 RepID=UPI002418AF12|nr:NAD(P)/FAD-dependent oxidoreductase [Nocardioides convexus]